MRALALIGMAMLLAACGPTPASSESTGSAAASPAASAMPTTSAAPAGEPADTSSAATAPLGTEVAFEKAGASVSRPVAAATGGRVSLTLADGGKVTLTIAKKALAADTIITLTERAAPGGSAIQIEPAGTYLAKPALLTVPKDWQQVLIRVGSTPDGLLFAPASRATDGSVVITRLRPVVFTDESITPVQDAQLPIMGVGVDGVSQVDEVDQAAAADEEQAAADPQNAESRLDDAAAAAGRVIGEVTGKCKEPNAGQRLVEARRTAGAAATTELPECLTRAIQVVAHLDIKSPEAHGVLDMNEQVAGSGMIDTGQESTSFPLQGEWEGAAQAGSLVLTAFAYAMGTYAGLDVPPPSKDKCQMSPLQDGTMQASVVEQPDDMLQITLNASGSYHETCGNLDNDAPLTVFSVLSQLKGGGEHDPLVVTLPKTGSSSNVFSMLGLRAEQGMKKAPNGDVKVSEGGIQASIGMTVTIAETMKDLNERNGASASP